MKVVAVLFALSSVAIAASSHAARDRVEPKVLEKVTPLPVALSNDFQFRKTKLFYLSEKLPKPGQGARQTTSTLGGKSNSPSQKTATLQDAPITFEKQYRMFGAITALDQRQRYGNYFDFTNITPVAGAVVLTMTHISGTDGMGLAGLQLQRVPEPGTMLLMVCGALGLFCFARRR